MTIHLDHLMVPSRNKLASAKLLAELLGVPWSETGVGPFAPVFLNDGLTIDFDEWTEPFPMIHYCFRVDQARLRRHPGAHQGSGNRVPQQCPWTDRFPDRNSQTAAASSTGTSRTVINGKC